MPAIDRYHNAVKHALVKDGWIIDAEQVTFITPERQVVIDIRASRRGEEDEIILVEVKGFERSPIEQLAIAIGKLQIYRFILEELGINLKIWLAVPEAAHQGILTEKIGLNMRQRNALDIVVFSPEREEIIRWIPHDTPSSES